MRPFLKYGFLILIAVLPVSLVANQAKPDRSVSCIPDTVKVEKGELIIFKDTIIAPWQDTMIFIPDNYHFKIKKNPLYKEKIFYDSLYLKSRKSKFWKYIYSLIVTRKPDNTFDEDNPEFISAQSSFQEYKGKEINEIRFVQVDPVGGSVNDTAINSRKGLGRAISKFHKETNVKVLKSNLIFKKGDTIQPVVLSDNERILRSLPGVEDAVIKLEADKLDTNKVNVIVITKDTWPWNISFNMKDWDRYDIKFQNANLFGTGVKVAYKSMLDFNHIPVYGDQFEFSANNILGSFINSEFKYYSFEPEKNIKLKFQKKFYSPLIKYGGEAEFSHEENVYDNDDYPDYYDLSYKKDIQEIWIGRSFHLGQIGSRKNFTIAALLNRNQFTKRPLVCMDSCYFFSNRTTYLFSLKFSKTKYYKVGMIKTYGKTEDIPTGYMGGITAGYLDSEPFKRPYLGLLLRYGNTFQRIGYFALDFELGGLVNVNEDRFSQAAWKTSLSYISPLLNHGLYRSRHFLVVSYFSLLANDIKKTVGFTNDIPGLSSVKGLSTLELNYEGVFFAPWYWLGFRFAPFIHGNMGLVGNDSDISIASSSYYSFGVGIRIRNESLAYNTIIIRLSYLLKTVSRDASWEFNMSNSYTNLFNTLDSRKPNTVNDMIDMMFR